MSAFREEPSTPAMRRSTKVALVLLGTAGVVGVATAWDAWQRAREHGPNPPAGSPPSMVPVNGDRAYANNDYIPGAGYYHAPFYGWFPFPWNFHNPSRGYFAGGQWQSTPFSTDLQSSRPTQQAVAAAVVAQRAAHESTQRSAQTSGFSSTSNRSSSFTSQPAASPSSQPSTTRGGFGSSSRGSSS